MAITISKPIIIWEKLPPDFPIPDDPVDNFNQPPLAAALTESLGIAGRILPQALIGTNCDICATVDGKIVSLAPDWFYVRSVIPPNRTNQTRLLCPSGALLALPEGHRSYTPHREGEVPIIAMEFFVGHRRWRILD